MKKYKIKDNFDKKPSLNFLMRRKTSSIFTSTAIALALSACGREVRSANEVPVEGQPCTPTAFDDECIGSNDLDTFTTLAGNDVIYGFGGNDQIIAGPVNDTIYGGTGNDNIQPGSGNDTIYGEEGNDTIYLSSGVDIEDGGPGIDTIIFGPDQTPLPVTINLDTGRYHFTSQIAAVSQNLFSIENITSEGSADLTIYDTIGANEITTNSGSDIIHSKGGNDVINTAAGNDIVYLGSGQYTIDLGAGDDVVYLTTSASIIEGNTGTDEAIVRAFDGFVDVYIDLKFSTYFVPSKLTAQDGMDVSLKSFEKVTIDGNVSATINGSAAADILVGDDGADTITGRGGADTLTGGNRSDKFIFSPDDTGITEATADTITDFSTGADKIDIQAPGTYVEVDGTANNFATFLTNAGNSFSGNADDLFAEYNLNGSGNTYLIVDEDKSGTVNA